MTDIEIDILRLTTGEPVFIELGGSKIRCRVKALKNKERNKYGRKKGGVFYELTPYRQKDFCFKILERMQVTSYNLLKGDTHIISIGIGHVITVEKEETVTLINPLTLIIT